MSNDPAFSFDPSLWMPRGLRGQHAVESLRVHEASHAVAAVALGATVSRVYADSFEGRGGVVIANTDRLPVAARLHGVALMLVVCAGIQSRVRAAKAAQLGGPDVAYADDLH